MINLRVLIFWISLWPITAHLQTKDDFLSLKEALAIHPDSVLFLDLSRQGLKVVPETIFQFKNLKVIDLSNNKLTELPSAFIFENLEHLILTNNKFHDFPAVICSNTQLVELEIGKNYLSEIPACIGELTNLVRLDIWFNTISILPETLTNLRSLRSIDLRGMNYSEEFQEKWNVLLPWVKIDFDNGCDCGL